MRYTERAITVVVIVACIWGIRELIGSRIDHAALFLGMTPLLLGTGIFIYMSKVEFERTNSAGVEEYGSFWHAGGWSLLRFLNVIFLIIGCIIAILAVFSA